MSKEEIFVPKANEPVTLEVAPASLASDPVGSPFVGLAAAVKVKKPRKPLSAEHKANLAENLKRGRATAAANRRRALEARLAGDTVLMKEQEDKIYAAKMLVAETKATKRAETDERQKQVKKSIGAADRISLEVAKLRDELAELKEERRANKARKALLKEEAARNDASPPPAVKVKSPTLAQPNTTPPATPAPYVYVRQSFAEMQRAFRGGR